MESFRVEKTSKITEFNLCHSTANPPPIRVPKCHINTAFLTLPGNVTPPTTALGGLCQGLTTFSIKKKLNLISNLTLLRASCLKGTSVVNQICIIFTVCSKYLLAQSQVAKYTIPAVSQSSLLPVILSACGLLN